MIFLFFAVLLCGKPLAFAVVSGFSFFPFLAPRGMGGNAAFYLLLSVLLFNFSNDLRHVPPIISLRM